MQKDNTLIRRVLVCHEDEKMRGILEHTVRDTFGGTATVYSCTSAAEVLRKSRQLMPTAVLLDVGRHLELAAEIVRNLRDLGCLVIGLYNPLTLSVSEGAFLRKAVRAGVSDFVPLPPSPTELREALCSSEKGMTDSAEEACSVAFFSPKGGVGTTTLALNTALVLAQRSSGRDVAICDTNLQSSELAGMIGQSEESSLAEFIRDLDHESPVESYVIQEPSSGLYVLPGAEDPVSGFSIQPEDLSRGLVVLRRRFAWLVLDTSSALDATSLAAMDLCETVCLVVTPCVTALRLTAQIAELLNAEGFKGRLRFVLNLATPEGNLSRKAAESELGAAFSAVIPYEKKALDAINRGEPLCMLRSRSDYRRAVEELAESVIAGQ